jgi:hypothetical protein
MSPREYSNLQITGNPGTRSGHVMAYDPHNEVVVMFGGSGGANTWTYDYEMNTWTELSLAIIPPSRFEAEMVYCTITNEMILYGGSGLTDTWSFSCESQSWQEVETEFNPGVHYTHEMSYDAAENVVVLFGGFDETSMTSDETWIFNCTSRDWIELTPSEVPLSRYGHAMIYDDSISKTILCCGNTDSHGHQDDTWTFDVSTNTWSEITTDGNPDNLKWPSMVYDSINKKSILFGGQIGNSEVNGTFSYDAQTSNWTRMEPEVAPGGRIVAGFAFDSNFGVSILYGGMTEQGVPYDDTWSYCYSTNTWTDLTIQDGPTCNQDLMTTSETSTSEVATSTSESSSTLTTTPSDKSITSSTTSDTITDTPDLTGMYLGMGLGIVIVIGVIIYVRKKSQV